jgi:hypothetical protein
MSALIRRLILPVLSDSQFLFLDWVVPPVAFSKGRDNKKILTSNDTIV